MKVHVGIESIIGFFVIIIVIGGLLHFLLSKTSLYNRKIKKGEYLSKFIYLIIFLVLLYIALLTIFGVIKLIGI